MTDTLEHPTPPPPSDASPVDDAATRNRPGPDDGLAVHIRGLVKRYGDLRAVDSLDLDVPTGGVFGLIGPNGAGKTTTMLSIVTLLTPDDGVIEVFGHDPRKEQREVRRVVGYMPDFFGLYEGLTCAEYLDFFASAYGVQGEERRAQVRDLLELVEMSHKATTDVAGLSRGMQQRMSLARALVHDPDLLVLDEPASGLDPRARVELREIMLELSRQGHTILVSSHILAELEEMCDRVGIIEAGKVLAQGTPAEIRDRMQTALTITLRVLGGVPALDRAIEVVSRHGATALTHVGAGIRFELAGSEDLAADLLADLIGEGLRVVDFREDRGGLERLFLSVTKGVLR